MSPFPLETPDAGCLKPDSDTQVSRLHVGSLEITYYMP